VADSAAYGNFENGFRFTHVDGRLLVARTSSSANGRGFLLESVYGGPVFILDTVAAINDAEGIGIQETLDDIVALEIRRSRIHANNFSGLELEGLATGGSFRVACNDIEGNGAEGLRLWSSVDLDATFVWWGDPSGPSGEGPGSGDSVLSGPGTITFDPWLLQSITSPASLCEIFSSGMDSGSIHEWDRVVQ